MSDLQKGYLLGLDIGGANIKLYHSAGFASTTRFPMWLQPEQLANSLVQLVSPLPPCQTWGVTMTGEMADVFLDRADGVRQIVQQTMKAAQLLSVDDVQFYAINSEHRPINFLSAADAIQSPDSAASANWHALASWVSLRIDRPSLLIDIGSTTVDVIPLSPGRVDTASRTDHDRLSRGELVYLGVYRTPVGMLVESLPMNGRMIPIMREQFANMDDVALLLKWVVEEPSNTDTCDRQPRTRDAAANRLARMVGLDHRQVSPAAASDMATHVMHAAVSKINQAAAQHPEHFNSQWVVSGHGGFLVHPPQCANRIELAVQLNEDISRVAPAYAICELLMRIALRSEQSP
jgi:(4-(4-[2-(gamma-L-glutamylamino)ethyl]phenoxymethyl)furan-2-yl)methanamine synthase